MTTCTAFQQPGRFFKGNLHTHSTESDGLHPPGEVCRIYREAGYDFLALSDHFLPKYAFPVTDTSAHRSDTFTTILSAEVHIPATSMGEAWHLLAVGLPRDFPATLAGETGPSLARRCHDAGAFIGIVHPSWYGLSLEDAQSIDCAHAVEIYNHTSAVKTDRGDSSALFDQMLATGRRMGCFASDDAHFHFNDAFGGWVMVKAESLRPELLVEALRQGHYYSSQGPLIHDIKVEEGQLEVRCSPARAVMLLGRGSKAVSELGQSMETATLSTELVANGGFGRVVVIGDDGRRAWSNPIWFDGPA
jgi:predicted metal-dependent phosphoesterase TrpH